MGKKKTASVKLTMAQYPQPMLLPIRRVATVLFLVVLIAKLMCGVQFQDAVPKLMIRLIGAWWARRELMLLSVLRIALSIVCSTLSYLEGHRLITMNMIQSTLSMELDDSPSSLVVVLVCVTNRLNPSQKQKMFAEIGNRVLGAASRIRQAHVSLRYLEVR